MSTVLTETFTGNKLTLVPKLDDGSNDGDFEGWFCIATDPYPCPGKNCSFIARHLTSLHKIIVWPEMDDPEILEMAKILKEMGRNPKIVEYEVSMGECISWYQLEAMRNPSGRYDGHYREE